MIQDLDETLRQLLIQKVPINPSAIEIMFERPNTEWENQLGSKPAINCFLYDIRENLEYRDPERYLTRNGSSGTETRDPVRMDLTYQMTVWAKDVDIEHRLLGNIMKALINYPILPQEIIQGDLRNQSRPLRAWFALPQDTPTTWDFWGANEWRLKAGFSYRITVAVEPTPVEVDLVTEKIINLQLRDPA